MFTSARIRHLLVFALGMLAAGCARDASFPSRPITLVCPWAAGGGTDTISRQIAAQLEEELGVPVNVVNATGGAGVTGHTRGANARPDGYTLTTITPELNMLHWRGLTRVDWREFEPLIMVNRDAAALFVKADSKWKSLQALTEDIRKRPGKFNASGTAAGGIWHLSLAGWLLVEKISPAAVNWVSINGANPSLQELNAGGIDMVCCSVPEAQGLLDGKQIRCLGVMAPTRLPGKKVKHIPTFAEQGVPQVHLGWRGLAFPKDVAPERKRLIAEALRKIVNSERYQRFLKQNNYGYAALAGDKFHKFLEQDDQKYGEILTSPELQAVQPLVLGPMFFPLLVGGLCLAALCFSTIYHDPAVSGADLMRFGMVAAWLILFVVAMQWLGFIVTACLLLVLLMALLRARWYWSIALPPALSLIVYQMFAVYLRVTLP